MSAESGSAAASAASSAVSAVAGYADNAATHTATTDSGAGMTHLVAQGDGVIYTVAVLLLLMSVSAWVLIFWKGWLLRRARVDIARAVPAFWASAHLGEGRIRLAAFDRDKVLTPLLDAAMLQPAPRTLDGGGQLESQLTRRLRDALHGVLHQLQFGQVLLASIGSTAPFLGLLGTVWGIYHALLGMSSARSVTIDKLAGPVGEALVMTAAGLAVAIPAVLAYNVFGKLVGACEAELEGFAFDLRQMISGRASTPVTRSAQTAEQLGVDVGHDAEIDGQ